MLLSLSRPSELFPKCQIHLYVCRGSPGSSYSAVCVLSWYWSLLSSNIRSRAALFIQPSKIIKKNSKLFNTENPHEHKGEFKPCRGYQQMHLGRMYKIMIMNQKLFCFVFLKKGDLIMSCYISSQSKLQLTSVWMVTLTFGLCVWGDYRRLVYPCICTFCCEAREGLLAASRHQHVHQKTHSECLYTALFKLTWCKHWQYTQQPHIRGHEEDKMIYIASRLLCCVSHLFQDAFPSKHILLLAKTAKQLPLNTSVHLPPHGVVFNHNVFLNSADFLLSVLYSCMITMFTAELTFSCMSMVLLHTHNALHNTILHTDMHVCTVCVYS